MSDSLLEGLRSSGAPVSRGGFSIDRAKAREKLSKFQLVDPHHYVLEFVQAAYLLGATYVDIELDTDEMRMTFDGESFGRNEVENLYRASFSRADTPRLRALRHIAIGVTAAWALDPAAFYIDVDDSESRLRATLSKDGQDVLEEFASGGKTETVIYLRESTRASHLLEFFRYLRGELAEAVALREYCAHADIPILVNNEPVSRGHKLPERAGGAVQIDTSHEKGRLGVILEAGIAPTHIQVLTNGVLTSEIHGSELPIGFAVIIDSSRLEKGLSQAEIVRDDAWHHVRDVVIREAVYRSLAAYAREIDDVTAATRADALRRAAAWIWSIDDTQLDEPAARSLNAAKRAMRSARIWNYAYRSSADAARGHETPLASLADIDRTFEGQAVPTSSWSIKDADAPGIPTALLVEPQFRHVFEHHFGARLRDHTSEIEQAMKRIARLHEFARRGKPRRPDPSYFMAHRLVERGDFRAFLGIRIGDRHARNTSTVKWNGRDLVLHERELGRWFPDLHIWINGPLLFQMDAPHFKASKPYLELVEAIMVEVPRLAADITERLPAPKLIDWARTLTDLDKFRELATRLEAPAARTEAMLADYASSVGAVSWDDLTGLPAPPSDDAIAGRIQRVGPLANTPLIEVGLERRVSLEELFEIYQREGRLLRAARMFPQLSGPLAVTGGENEVELVERFFGPLDDANAHGEHEVFEALQSMPPAPQPEALRASDSSEPEVNAEEVVHPRYELDSRTKTEPPVVPDHEPPGPRFLESIERAVDTASAERPFRNVVLEMRAGLPAAVLDGSTCVINGAHPIVSAAADHPTSPSHQRWAETAIWTALAAGGTRTEREFAFGQLSDMVEGGDPDNLPFLTS
ncbi:MAG: hypothetical protein ACQEVA_19620 [Myxococcota bacterium]